MCTYRRVSPVFGKLIHEPILEIIELLDEMRGIHSVDNVDKPRNMQLPFGTSMLSTH